MRDPNLPAATLVVDHWSATCNACGQECNPDNETHDRILGYGPHNGEAGCGIKWTHIYTDYVGEFDEMLTRSIRPDLEFIPIELPNAAE